MDTINNTLSNPQTTIDDEQLILYAIGELTADEMVDIDEIAFVNSELNEKLESLLQLVEVIETSPELEQALVSPSMMAEFLQFLLSFGKKIWPWRKKDSKSESWLALIGRKFHEWTTLRQEERIRRQLERRTRSKMGGMTCGLLASHAIHSLNVDNCFCDRLCAVNPDMSFSSLDRYIAPPLLPNALDGFTAEKKNGFLTVADNPFSTFGLDVDTASYTMAKQYIKEYGQLPPPESVREEEYINYFDWDLPKPEQDSVCPFRPTVEIGPHPLQPNLLLAKIGVQGKVEERNNVKPMNLTYLIDVSGSMEDENKLGLIKESLRKQVNFLRDDDTISIVIYGSTAKVVLSATPVKHRKEIKSVIDSLRTEGCTNASEGLMMAYKENQKRFNPEGVNRILFCSDGDFNVGITENSQLASFIKQQAKSGIFLTVLGFGMGNYKDNTMETLANYGQGSYHYINNKKEAKRVLEDENFGSMVTIAKDVKVQIDFNPAKVQSYRLIGYENRVMEAKDFNNDNKESGNIGMGQNALALYEIVPVGETNSLEPSVDKSRYEKFQKPKETPTKTESAEKQSDVQFDPLNNELFLLKIRWKEPTASKSQYQDFPIVMPTDEQLKNVTPDFKFAYAIALFAQILSDGNYTAGATFDDVLKLIPDCGNEQRQKFAKLVTKASRVNSAKGPEVNEEDLEQILRQLRN